MRKFPEDFPKERERIIVYSKNNFLYLCEYKDVLTWRGYKKKFVNVLSRFGEWVEEDEIIGWNRIPTTEHTI